MEFDSLFWWNFWVVIQVLAVAGIVLAFALFIRWGTRKSAILESNRTTEGHGRAGAGT
ncbi:hypothetical protein SAMN05216219_0650 [Mycetocola miduiensis]|uniref:Uncharacterized protein n=1 Tax=Mycetocola miduiensis TaxID=995034 RepID=A0A1I4Z0N6_9MICO|nr:hypothetical protein SAMN05216219_0650 [Mycetocola miduiensis]